MRADILADGDLRAGRRWRSRLRLAHARERQRPERSETAGDKTGAAEEGTAVDSAVRVTLQRTGERAATSLTFRSLDQHACLPQLGYRLTR